MGPLAGTPAAANARVGGRAANAGRLMPRAGAVRVLRRASRTPAALLLMLSLSLVLAGPVSLWACHRLAVHSMIRRRPWSVGLEFSDLSRHPPRGTAPLITDTFRLYSPKSVRSNRTKRGRRMVLLG